MDQQQEESTKPEETLNKYIKYLEFKLAALKLK